MKKANRFLLYLVCFATIGYLLVCAGSMVYSILEQSLQSFWDARQWMHQAADWYKISLSFSAVAWLVLKYLEKPVHRRDLSGYALIILAATAFWFSLRIADHYDARIINSLPWHFAVFIDAVLFVPVLMLEMVAFFFLRYRGKQNYPEEYGWVAQKPKRAPRRIRASAVVFLVTVVLLCLLICWCYPQFGGRMEITVAVDGYKVSDDGTVMTLSVSPMSSWYNYNQAEHEIVDDAVYLRYYYNFSPYYQRTMERCNPYELELPAGCTEIYIYDPISCTNELVLKWDGDSGLWLERRWDSEADDYYFVYDDYFPEYYQSG